MIIIQPSVPSPLRARLVRALSRRVGYGAASLALAVSVTSGAVAQKKHARPSSPAAVAKSARTAPKPTDPSAPPVPATPATPYSMRGVPLGITLAEFRALPVPGDADETNRRNLCTTDDPASARRIEQVDPEDVKNGIVTCNWFGNRVFDAPLFIALGEGWGSPAFDFVDDGTQKRLFRIRFYANSEFTNPIRRGLTTRYGEPAVTTDTVRTGAGNEFEAPILTWSNGASSITLESPCRRIDRYCLTYRHAGLYKFYNTILVKRAAAAAEKF